jgi:hypothetical protein
LRYGCWSDSLELDRSARGRHGFGKTVYHRVDQLQHRAGYSPSSVAAAMGYMNRDISSANGSAAFAHVKHLATAFGSQSGGGSSSRKGGHLYVGKPGKATRDYRWGRFCEDLWYRGNANEVLSLTKAPGGLAA